MDKNLPKRKKSGYNLKQLSYLTRQAIRISGRAERLRDFSRNRA
jgi:hypothetical protein